LSKRSEKEEMGQKKTRKYESLILVNKSRREQRCGKIKNIFCTMGKTMGHGGK
jgi:hypothetical protein